MERLFHVDSLLGGGLEVRDVALGLAPCHGALVRDLYTRFSTRKDTYVVVAHLSLAFLDINLVAEDNEREVLRIVRAGLDKELVPPTVQGLERFRAVDVVYEDTAIRASVKGHAE